MPDKILKTSRMTEVDRYTIEHEPVSPVDLMERAARIWTEKLLEKFPSRKHFTVSAGGGNNGGDGFAIARMLRARGREAVVWYAGGDSMSRECEINRGRWKGESRLYAGGSGFTCPEHSLIIDALFGSGLNRTVTGEKAELIQAVNSSGNTVAAVDIPSGLFGEDNGGNDREAIVRADYTFTFQLPKLSFFLPENAPYVGEWEVLDIGLHPEAVRREETDCYYLTERSIRRMLPRPGKFDHKGTNGHALLVAGSAGMMGAAVLAGRGALGSGIGLLSMRVPESERQIIQIALPEAVLAAGTPGGSSSGPALSRYDAVGVGPGIGTTSAGRDQLQQVLTEWKGRMVLDADALNILAASPEWLKKVPRNAILTPHPKEFERLAGKSGNDFERLNKLSNFAASYGVVILLKGAHTVVATPGGRLYFNTTGNPGMAKGGMGDVLTGVLLALLARGIPSEEAALIGVYVHGRAGDIAVAETGLRGLCAGEMPRYLGKAWKSLEGEQKD